ncbi:TetR/AcrR family transcriptional regulator [Streptoalloteichus tenebrarius]|uniref:TetR/AcrR family transcriptional regulator n=1 Tax=Streptoalloteichus tenebrarius (strain ATCC 17920 / DSM 40477 / JCM 4838 / CBS 697.72 / NBRC 16177 / NCIMB 11028 / NRRL B-12390 / A12253. 1 / ISP 5477) TaxID=1933 RepID=UPI0020A5F86D|nr:TetR/AcrR family transcriptional regulator [Streptoalloteichus tenebrarius]
MGLRETKKQQTRRAIADAALPLFLERGFDRVTVAEVARHVGVSAQTVFNYFPTKEDLFFDRQAEVEGELAAIVRDRQPGRCPVEAVRDQLVEALERDRSEFPTSDLGLRFWQVLQDSPALRAREREIAEGVELALAAELEKEGTVPVPAVLAGAIAGIHRAVQRELRRRVMAGEDGAQVRRELVTVARTAFDTLCHGLHGA